MEQAEYHRAKNELWWDILASRTDERYSPRTPWWFDNRTRPRGPVIFQVVRAGRCIFRTVAGDQEVGAGTAFIFAYDEPTAYGRPPDRPQWPGADEALRMDYICLNGAGLRELWHLLCARFGHVVHIGRRPRCLTLIADIERQLRSAEKFNRRASSTLAHAFVMSLFEELEAGSAEGLGAVERAIEELLGSPLSVNSLKEVAVRHGCAREHLCRVFSQRMKMSPGRWLRQARLERVQQLLRATDLPLATIAIQTGFSNVRTMGRLVQRLTGLSAGALRKRR
jgi:AraC-like DNA-binding protein